MLTHRATYGPIAALNVSKDPRWTVDYLVLPRAVFTQPALGGVGVAEYEATVMNNRGTLEPIFHSIHIHPTPSELVKDTGKQLR